MAIKINSTTVIDDNRNISSVGVATIGSGSSITTINGNTGIVNVGTGVTINGISGNISIAGTVTAAGFNVPLQVVSFSPVNGATGVDRMASITITFNQSVGTGNTGYVYLRSGSASGTILQTLGVNDVYASQNGITIKSTLLPVLTNIFPVIENGFIKSTGGNFSGLNLVGVSTYSFKTRDYGVGESYENANIICVSGGVRWLVSPYSAEVSRTWYARGDANTRAQAVTGYTGWFVPSSSQMVNPGYSCRTYWDNYTTTSLYWSDTQAHAFMGVKINMNNGNGYVIGHPGKAQALCVRAFRCVTY